MIGLRDAAAGIYGAWRLAWADEGGLAHFDASERGFWLSFWAAVLAAPAYALVVAINVVGPQEAGAPEIDGLRLLLVEAIAYVIGWTAFPLAMVTVADRLGRGQYYARYIVANNWGSLLEMMAFLPAVAVAQSVPALTILPALVAIAMFAYQWFIARTALALSSRQALVPVAINFAIGVAVALAAREMIATPVV
ncbi:MAG: hypothetical protein ACK4NA_08065 [Alphaproteobacteria bacterium]